MKPKPQDLFHVSVYGFGSATWCGLPIHRFGVDQQGIDWGGSIPSESTTCVECIESFTRDRKRDLAEAARLLKALRNRK